MTVELTREQARNTARVLHAVHQRRAARLAAEAAVMQMHHDAESSPPQGETAGASDGP